MSIAATTAQNALTSAQRMVSRQTPDADFFRRYTQAFAAQVANSAAGGDAASAQVQLSAADSSRFASSAAQASERLLANLLGDIHANYSARRGVGEADQAAYAEILNRAYMGGGMADPAHFLQTLTPSELAIVQRNHSLAEPIEPAGLSREGAYNLLLPEGWRVDFDGNDLVEVGTARLIQFPPLDAPANFNTAWTETTKDMAEMDISNYGLKMFIGMHTLTDPPMRRMAADSMDSYQQLVSGMLEMLEHFRSQLPAGQYERDQAFFSRLQTALS